ncbi:MAG: hypothetical protein V2A62_02350 [Candidatus Woesearchaeota archaeon]
MVKLKNELNWTRLQHLKSEIVPVLFTEHQFNLINKKAQQQELTASEKVEFSRSVLKKIKVLAKIIGKEDNFIYGQEKILPHRLVLAKKYLKEFSRRFRNKRIIISGSFLYSEKYNDIDTFVIEKYDKDDFHKENIHFNYLPPKALDSLFINSLRKICLTNFDLNYLTVKETITSSQIISKYQEIRQDLAENKPGWLKIDLRDFIINCYYASNRIILDPIQLKDLLNHYLEHKNKDKLIQKLFVNTLLTGFSNSEIKKISQQMIKSYREILKEYSHPEYYNPIINTFQEVLNCAD